MSKTLQIIIGIIVIIIIVVLLVIFYKPGPKEAVRIGVLTPLTGPVSEYGENTKKGIELAVEEINNAGGVSGRQIQLFYEDSKCDSKESVSGFNKLVDINQVKVILGTICSSETLSIAPLANEKKILIISTGASSPEITNAGDYIFRVYPSDDHEAGVAAETIFNEFKKTRVSVLYLNNDYGVALKNTFKDKFIKLGGIVLNEEGYLQEAKDFRSQLVKIKTQNPEVIYMISYPKDGGIIIKQVKEMGIDAIFLGTSGLKANDFVSAGGSATEGFILVAIGEHFSPQREAFVSNYEKKFGVKPGLTSDMAYDSVYLLKKAFERARNIEDVKDNLYKIKGFKGASGEISFDQKGDLTDINYELLIIKNGQFVPLEDF